jgi:nickel-dependent lactate racemase
MTYGYGFKNQTLTVSDVTHILTDTFSDTQLDGKRVLVIIPDSTRTAPLPMMFRLLYAQLGQRVAQLDYLIALGTHQPMSDEAIERLIGVSSQERAAQYPHVQIFNHHWEDPDALRTIGVISSAEARQLTDGTLDDEVPVTLNRMIFEYDQLIICGPVFPHEVAGFSGGAKYLFPGIAGADIINFSHWLGARMTSMATIGVKDTHVRRVIHRAAEFVTVPLLCISMVLQGQDLHGVYTGTYRDAFEQAAELSGQLNVVYTKQSFTRVLSMASEQYDDLWTAAKAMYKTEPAIADGGEVIIYAPHITEVSYTHGQIIDQIGYHVRDYFLQQWERFKDIPGGILAHSTHVKGSGTYDPVTGREVPRIQVTLATGIPEERCRRINLGYLDYHTIDPHEWENRTDEGLLLVPHAGEVLFRRTL